jgi:myo-inositol-hexaphosphate 3-phosphohydrolase
MISGIETLDGILLVRWTTALLFAEVQRCWKFAAEKNERPDRATVDAISGDKFLTCVKGTIYGGSNG